MSADRILTQTRRGIRRLRNGAWAVVQVTTRYDHDECADVRCGERLLDECTGVGAKRRAIRIAGTNEVV